MTDTEMIDRDPRQNEIFRLNGVVRSLADNLAHWRREADRDAGKIAQRRDFLGSRYGGRRYTDAMTVSEKSAHIEDLKGRKCSPVPVESDKDEGAELTAKQRLARRKGTLA